MVKSLSTRVVSDTEELVASSSSTQNSPFLSGCVRSACELRTMGDCVALSSVDNSTLLASHCSSSSSPSSKLTCSCAQIYLFIDRWALRSVPEWLNKTDWNNKFYKQMYMKPFKYIMFIYQNNHLLKLILTNEFSLHVIKASFKVLYFICNDVQIYRFKYWVFVLDYFRNLSDVSVHNLETHSLTVSRYWISSPLRRMIFPNHIYGLFWVLPHFIIVVAL